MGARIIVISDSIRPSALSHGGDIIFYRHLSRFEESGYTVLLVHAEHPAAAAGPFKKIRFRKKWWYPPIRKRFPALIRLRCRLLASRLMAKVQISKEDILLSAFGEYTNLAAWMVSAATGARHVILYHDDFIFNAYGKLNVLDADVYRRIAADAARVLVVSDEMDRLIRKEVPGVHAEVLYPIPGNIPANQPMPHWRAEFESQLPVCYGGTVFFSAHYNVIASIVAALAGVNGTLTIYSSRYAAEEAPLNDLPGCRVSAPLPPGELQAIAIAEYAAMLVFYSFDPEQEPRLRTSFPSKFPEFTQTGLPVILVAPPESTLGSWAIKNNWSAYCPTADAAALTALLTRLKDRGFWELCAAESRHVAGTQFDPEKIHARFSESIRHHSGV